MTATLAQVGERGELLIPAEMLEALRLEDDRQVRLELRDGEIVVRPAHQRVSLDEIRNRFRQGKGEGLSKEELDTFSRELRGPL